MSISGIEWIIILGVALLLFGPKKLPELGRAVGKSFREFKQATSGIVSDLDEKKEDEDSNKSTSLSQPTSSTPAQVEEAKPTASVATSPTATATVDPKATTTTQSTMPSTTSTTEASKTPMATPSPVAEQPTGEAKSTITTQKDA
ncbi:Sec-independent protein translocase subunit TatA/TatB [Hazenella coriacea]|uniref:Sec-independent protein translocase protein TatA n=1 Tax=Hazenella coriacea TaxID=1179467 RepID=A0A4R3L8F5_9BACL|nr:twin-arginine translocase TatA/TatE family subunit [Hazenella coriacea]TCS95852.1 TatA/E family protein of Tat protein translocase [Hazenella coriacea]